LIVAKIKSKQFKETDEHISGLPQNMQTEFMFEHAYALHRLGDNQRSQDKLKEIS